MVSERCGGNPFYITAVVRQAARRNKELNSEEILNEMLAVDLSSGFIWAELYDQVNRWTERWCSGINEHNITKWILYLAVLEEEEKINPGRIKEELWRRERREVALETIRDVLIKLSRGDLIDYKEFGGWFRKIKDPILAEFLKVWGRIEVDGEDENGVRSDTVIKYLRTRKQFYEYKGYLAEVYMIQILWNAQGKTIPGEFFHSPEDIRIPDRFFFINQRNKIRAGKGVEIDIYASAGLDVWIAESKWWSGEKVGLKVVEELLNKEKLIREREGEDLRIRMWLFAHDGVAEKAKTLMEKHHILWSTREDLDALLAFVNLRKLPQI